MNSEWIDELYRLKELPRTGWLRIGIEQPESVAEHSFAVALIAWRLAVEAGLDERRVLLMALLHDFHEARMGDIPSPEKRRLDEEALRSWERRTESDQWSELPELPELLEELRRGESEEARLVAAVDALELLLQARRYREAGHVRAEEFICAVLADRSPRPPSVEALLASLEGKKNPPPMPGGG